MEKPPRCPALLALLCAVLACLAPELRAQRREPAGAPVPPQPLAFSVKVKRTEPADIGLRIYG